MEIPQQKLAAIASQLQVLLKVKKVFVTDLQSVVGRLLLIPLYKILRQIPLSMAGVSPEIYAKVVDKVDVNLRVDASLSSHHYALTAGVQIKRVANTFVDSKAALQFTRSPDECGLDFLTQLRRIE